MSVWYCTREDVKNALDVKETARNNAQIDREIEASSESAEDLCHRVFYPQTKTRYFDWPNAQMGTSYVLWFDENDLISASSVIAGGAVIPPSAYNLEPVNAGPPFNRLELNLGTSASFNVGNTHQRDIGITGVWGFTLDSVPAGTMATGVNATATTLDVTDGSAIGVGTLLFAGTERIIVTGRTVVGSAQALTANLAASAATVLVPVNDGTGFHIDETILIDAEQMLIVDIAGNNLIVKRAWNGSVLAAHLSLATIYVGRRLIVERGALGSQAVTQAQGTVLARWRPPGLVREFTIAQTLTTFAQESSQYARTIGSGDTVRNASGAGIADIRKRLSQSRYARKGRVWVVGR